MTAYHTPPTEPFANNVLRPPRPMLSRDAEGLYWMSRYLERTEHVARTLHVTANLLIDLGELAPPLQERHWRSLPEIFRVQTDLPHFGPVEVLRLMSVETANPNSLINCITRARENARGNRESISADMWECVNALYLLITSDEAALRLMDTPDEFLRSVVQSVQLFQGLCDQTLAHDQGWRFVQLGKLLERVDVTCRIIGGQYAMLSDHDRLDAPLRNLHWMAMLRSCTALEAYRRIHVGDLDPQKVTAFLLLDASYPRTVLTCVRAALVAMSAIRMETYPLTPDPAERVLGRLVAELMFAEPGELQPHVLGHELLRIQTAVSDASLAIHKRYFLY